jgi:phosphoglycolate phosphatase-like HAD superfamily hydrolase
MRALADHVREVRASEPDEELVVAFDIDGTIVDTRYLVVNVLVAYDRARGSEHFRGLTADDVRHHETRIDEILEPFDLAQAERADIRRWYLEHARDPIAIAAAHRPYQGVMSVIRWFQLQPHMHVAINTGRPESTRAMTLASLNALGTQHRVTFRPELLHMCADGQDVAAAKIQALRALRADGYRVVAVVDNEPAMIRAMADADRAAEILFLHADTIFDSRREPTPRTISGDTYGLAGLVDEIDVGRRVALAWHGVNDEHNLRQFVASEVRWAELDVRRDPIGRLVLRHDGFAETPWSRDEPLMLARDCLEVLRWEGRSVKLDLKEDGDVLEEIVELARRFGFADEELWFNGSIETIGGAGFARLSRERPGAILQCPVDFLVPLMLAAPEAADDILQMLHGWGLTRVSLDWSTPGMRAVLDPIERRGWEVNLYGVPDLESFLEAALLLPASVTADFNFPAWNHFGRGPTRGVAMAAGPSGR